MLTRTLFELGHLVRERRKARGLTQAGLAALVGASRKWVIDLEAGKRTSDLSLVLRTLNAIGLDLDVRERDGDREPNPRREAPDVNAIVDDAMKRKRR